MTEIDVESIQKISKELIRGRMSPGIDKINKAQYIKNENVYIKLVHTGITTGKYNFSKYKQLLKIKSVNKYPRKISIPVLRDKLMLKTINELFLNPFVKRQHICDIVKNIEKDLTSNRYNNYIKIDVEAFYDTINIKILLEKLKAKNIPNEVIILIYKALTTTTVDANQNKRKIKRRDKDLKVGVKQGLTISNALAEIYLSDFDKLMNGIKDIKYYRFVDDLLILYDSNSISIENLDGIINKELKNLELSENGDKRISGVINKDEIRFLGYLFKNGKVSFSKEIICKKERRIERIVFDFKNSKRKLSIKFLQWKLNLEIAGFVSNNKYYGWLYFYHSLTDLSILYHFDIVTAKILKRAGLLEKVSYKTFVESYYDIKSRKHAYNFDTLYPNTESKKQFLIDTIGLKIDSDIKNEVIENIFNDAVQKLIYDFERDLDFKYGV